MYCSKRKFILLIIMIVLGIYLTLQCDFHGEYAMQYFILVLSYFFVGWLMIYPLITNKVDIFEPYLLVIGLLWLIFSVAPIVLTKAGKTHLYGVDFMGGCIRATVVYFLGCMAFYVGYFRKRRFDHSKEDDYVIAPFRDESMTLLFMGTVWAICYAIGLFYALRQYGISIGYIVTLGMQGTVVRNDGDSMLGFLSNFTFCLPIPWLYIMQCHKRWLKYVTTFLMFALYLIMGARFILIVWGLAYATVWFISHRKRPSAKLLIAIMIVLLFFISFMGAARSGLKRGTAYDFSSFSKETILIALESNFNIYQPFYGIVEDYPSTYGYTLGEGMVFNTIITFIPRMFWSGKPMARDYVVPRAMRLSLGDSVIDKAAMAIPNIGEFYIDFGIIGVILIMFIYGNVLQRITKKLKRKNTSISNIIGYAVLYAVNFQLVIRGYTPNNFYLVIFMMMPHWLYELYIKEGA